MYGGRGGLELAKTKQNKQKMDSFSPESFPIEQSLYISFYLLDEHDQLLQGEIDLVLYIFLFVR